MLIFLPACCEQQVVGTLIKHAKVISKSEVGHFSAVGFPFFDAPT